MNLNSKKLFLIGFAVVLLVGIPLTVFLLQQQQEVRSRAEKSTNITFSPDSTAAAPISKNVGDTIPLDITVDPGKNLVSFVKLEIQYDPEVLATASADAFKANTTAFPSVLEGPVYSPGKIAVTLSVGPDPTKAIQQKVTAATVSFKAIKNTAAGTPTLVTFTTNTQVLSIGSGDQASENVLSSATPATIAIGGAAVTEPPPVASESPTIAIPDVPTEAPPSEPPLPSEPPPSAEPTVPISDIGGTPGTTTPPTCSSLVVDRQTSGNAPFSITFTANGTSSTGTISEVSFNFGDGQVSDVTEAGGIGTESVNVQASHTYNNPGTYQASAILTDDNNNVSVAGSSCQQTITVAASGSASTSGSGAGTANPSPTMPPTGSTEVAIAVGLGALMLIIGGGLLFFIL